jgi:1,4-alpha-glucan branching enzyme
MIEKQPGPDGTVRVTFSLPSSIWADTIHLVGDFNDWNPNATPLHLDESTWNVTLDLIGGRPYRYRYLVNGTEWVNDWQADSFAPNGKDGEDTIVMAVLPHEKSYPDLQWKENRSRLPLRVIPGGKLSGGKKAV